VVVSRRLAVAFAIPAAYSEKEKDGFCWRDNSTTARMPPMPVDVRSIALFTWAAAFLHLLAVFAYIPAFSLGSLLLALTAFASTLPAGAYTRSDFSSTSALLSTV